MTAELRSARTGEGARPYVSIAVPHEISDHRSDTVGALADQGEEFGAGLFFIAEAA